VAGQRAEIAAAVISTPPVTGAVGEGELSYYDVRVGGGEVVEVGVWSAGQFDPVQRRMSAGPDEVLGRGLHPPKSGHRRLKFRMTRPRS